MSREKLFLRDLTIIGLSIVGAIVLVKANILEYILASTSEFKILGTFIAGMFFTSVFTTTPAIITLGEIATVHPILYTAIFGASGAVVGDLIIFRFIKDRFSKHLLDLIENKKSGVKIKILSKFKFFRWITFLMGGLIIASPLPDELGVSLLGFSKIKTRWFMGISFLFNFIGITLIGLLARSI